MKLCFWGNISGALKGSTVGGAELQTSLLATALALNGHDVVIIDPYADESFVTDEGVRLIKVPGWNKGIRGLRFFWYRVPALWKVLASQKADYYYVRTRSYLHLIPYLAARKNRSKFILGIASDVDVMNFSKKLKYSYRGSVSLLRLLLVNIPNDIVFNYLLSKSDLVILQHAGQSFGASSLRRRQAIFPNIIKSTALPVNNCIQESYFIYVGTLTMLKGADNLLKLIDILDESIKFKIVGLPLGKMPAKIYEELGEKKNVELMGRKGHIETLQLISHAKALINISHYEGFSNTFLEAWSQGVPVISLNVNPGDILNKYDLGVCCNGDIKKMKEIIESDSTSSINSVGLTSYISKYHNFDTAAQRFEEILKNYS